MAIDYLPTHLTRPGRFGLTSCPGRAAWAPLNHDPLALDLMAMRGAGVDRIVCLLPSREMARLGVSALLDVAASAGLAPWHLPIEDGGVPHDLGALREVLAEVRVALTAGQTVVAHCQAGLGRTGVFAACCLIAGGAPPALAIERVRDARPGAIESALQERFLHGLSARALS